jgi:SAM-dependent methyltransferase
MSHEPVNWDERYATKNTPWDSGQPSLELQRVLKEHALRPCRTLELGCGTGTNAIYLAKQGFDVTAVDVSSLAIEQATKKAVQAGVNVRFLEADILKLPDVGPPFALVFDRGVYHHLRTVDLEGFRKTLARVTATGGYYLTLAGNANEPDPEQKGPPQVHAHELCQELSPLFELVQLREFRFDGVVIEGREVRPLAWSALLRRKGS